MTTSTSISIQNGNGLETPHEFSRLVYHRPTFISWLIFLTVLVALTSYSTHREKPIIIMALRLIILFFFFSYTGFYLCYGFREERKNSNTEVEPNIQQNETVEVSQPSSDMSIPPKRLHYLDNVKTFLTALVVSHHVSSSFGGVGKEMWTLIIASPLPGSKTIFSRFISTFIMLNQAYFMPLFFFISAYFVPKSFERRKTWEFHYDKAKRLMVPFNMIVFIVWPINVIIGETISNQPFTYTVLPGQGWFLIWLTMFNIMYSKVASRQQAPTKNIRIPGFVLRVGIGGGLICGGCMAAVVVALRKKDDSFFIAMPITIGSLVCDILFFIMGIVAYHNGWLKTPIREQLDISIALLRVIVIIEAVMLFFAFEWFSSPIASVLGYTIAGVFCVDMSTVVLDFFQTYADWSNSFSKFLADSAYTVYLIHPIVVTFCTGMFVLIYRVGKFDEVIEFEGYVSYSKLVGLDEGGAVLFLGWLVCNILSLTICWPIAYFLKTLPLLKHIL